MTGTLFSDSTAILPAHDRSVRRTHPSTRQQHYSCFRQRPLSTLSVLPNHHSLPVSPDSSLPDMSDRPTLPGIASILAFAGQHRSGFSLPSPTSHSHPQSNRLQSSDPVAHALPSSAAIPSIHKIQPPSSTHHPTSPAHVANFSNRPENNGHRRRSSSITVVSLEKPTAPLKKHDSHHSNCLQTPVALTCPPSSVNTSFSAPSIPPAPSHYKAYWSGKSFSEDTFPSARDQPLNSFHSSPAESPRSLLNNHSGLRVADDSLQRRHSERISGPHSRTHHHSSCSRNTSSCQSSCLTPDLSRSRQHSFTTTPVSSSPVNDSTFGHIRRPSNTSISSSSSLSGSASLPSDFGASLNIGTQANIHFGTAHPCSSSLSTNSTLPSRLEKRASQSLHPNHSYSPDNENGEHVRDNEYSNIDDQRRYDHHRRWDSHDSHGSNRTGENQCFGSPSQTSMSPETLLSCRLGGPPMNNTISAQGAQNHRYQCMEPGCGKTFSRPSSLKIHSYSHTGQKPFKCMRCDRAFSVQSNLKRHQKVHEKRIVGGAARNIVNTGCSTPMVIVYERGSGQLIEEESAEDEHGSDQGMEDQMEE